MTTALFVLRCIQVGFKLTDLDILDYGTVLDILTENKRDYDSIEKKDGNDSVREATQADYDKF